MSANPFTKHKDYRIRRTHVADIREPLVKALWYWRYAQRCSSQAGEYVRDPEATAHWQELVEEVQYATQRCNSILADLRTSRALERLSDAPGIVPTRELERNEMEAV